MRGKSSVFDLLRDERRDDGVTGFRRSWTVAVGRNQDAEFSFRSDPRHAVPAGIAARMGQDDSVGPLATGYDPATCVIANVARRQKFFPYLGTNIDLL